MPLTGAEARGSAFFKSRYGAANALVTAISLLACAPGHGTSIPIPDLPGIGDGPPIPGSPGIGGSTPIPIPDLPESGIQLSTIGYCKLDGVEFRLP